MTALVHGLGSVANDNPFAPLFKSTNKTVPQRVKDITKAKQLMAAAGKAGPATSDLSGLWGSMRACAGPWSSSCCLP